MDQWLSGKYGAAATAIKKQTKCILHGWYYCGEKKNAKFQIKIFRMWYDYNSSDIIIKTKGLKYYGVSLKKKRRKSVDPTRINKAFDSRLVLEKCLS